MSHAQTLEPFGGAQQALLPLQAGKAEHRVVHHVEMREEGVVLGQISELPILDGDVDPLAGVEEDLSVERDPARVGGEHAEQQAQQRGLAGAVGARDKHRLATESEIDAQVDLADPPRDGDLKHREGPRPGAACPAPSAAGRREGRTPSPPG